MNNNVLLVIVNEVGNGNFLSSSLNNKVKIVNPNL